MRTYASARQIVNNVVNVREGFASAFRPGVRGREVPLMEGEFVALAESEPDGTPCRLGSPRGGRTRSVAVK
ncbi:hypothetical protein SAV14893_011840 [Streptomyces avermitilis]|uniref:Uncharacterized protein n=1 Tax=Streptomyces avermitilis TaxID=33903 RepID=A0A4D4LJN4_STRAX|nr:hypothetical protein SAV14893_011840 [Streptomyces avermitilis]